MFCERDYQSFIALSVLRRTVLSVVSLFFIAVAGHIIFSEIGMFCGGGIVKVLQVC